MTNEEFYAECAALLGVDHEGKPFTHYRRTRWNNRTPGQGRYPGCGIIRVFGSTVHIALNSPSLSGTFSSKEDALVAIRNLLTELD